MSGVCMCMCVPSGDDLVKEIGDGDSFSRSSDDDIDDVAKLPAEKKESRGLLARETSRQ